MRDWFKVFLNPALKGSTIGQVLCLLLILFKGFSLLLILRPHVISLYFESFVSFVGRATKGFPLLLMFKASCDKSDINNKSNINKLVRTSMIVKKKKKKERLF